MADDASSSGAVADRLVAKWVLGRYRTHATARRPVTDQELRVAGITPTSAAVYEMTLPESQQPHLVTCPHVTVTYDAATGPYSDETADPYTQFTATIECQHGERDTYAFGEWGDLPEILAALEALSPGGR